MIRRSAFSLLEVMIVIAIIVAISGLVLTNVMGAKDSADVDTTRITIKEVEKNLQMYRARYKAYPTTDEGLEKLVETGILTQVPLDAWNEPLEYVQPGNQGTKDFDLWSKGRDKTDGGDGLDADITNWEEENRYP